MEPLIVELGQPADLPELLSLYAQLDDNDPALDQIKAASIWSRLMQAEGTVVMVARTEGKVVGSCTLTIVPNLPRGGQNYAVIENVVTDVDRRKRGIGRAVLDAAVAWAWDADCYKVMLATGSRREETLRFYSDAGFAQGRKTYFEAKRP
jgi:GNAT superfamily N-acetyltransferase